MAMCICTLLLLRQPRPVKAKGGLVRRVFRAGLAFYLLLTGVGLAAIGARFLPDLVAGGSLDEDALILALILIPFWLGLFILTRPKVRSWQRWLFRLVGLVSIPPLTGLVIMFVNILRGQVIITPDILGILMAIFWALSMVFIISFTKVEDVRIQLISLALLMTAAALGPWSAMSLSEHINASTLKSLDHQERCVIQRFGMDYLPDDELKRHIRATLMVLDLHHGFSWLPARSQPHSPRRSRFALRCTGYDPEKPLQALPSQARPYLAMLYSYDFNRRAWAALQLARFDQPALPAAPHLIRCLGDTRPWSMFHSHWNPTPTPHQAARKALLEIGQPAIPYLIQALKIEREDIAHQAGRMLEDIAPRRSRVILSRLSRDPKARVRARAVAVLGGRRKAGVRPWAETLLIEALQDPARAVRRQATRSLERSKVKSNVPEHIRLGEKSPRQILKQTAYPCSDLPFGRSWKPPEVGRVTVTEVPRADLGHRRR